MSSSGSTGKIRSNRMKVHALWPYLTLGIVLWVLVFASGVQATLAGVLPALAIPLRRSPGSPAVSHAESLLHRLEHLLHKLVAFAIVPVFGFANAGVSPVCLLMCSPSR